MIVGTEVEIGKEAVRNGIYTMTSPSGEHKTFRVSTAKGLDGKPQIVALLIGQNNAEDYLGLAFIRSNQTGVNVFKKHSGSRYESLVRAFWDVATGTPQGQHWIKLGMKLDAAVSCRRCNRLLTTPQSIDDGIGPECATKGLF